MTIEPVDIYAGATFTGETWSAQLLDSDGANLGSAITTGFTNLGGGVYTWRPADVDDSAVGVVFTSDPNAIVRRSGVVSASAGGGGGGDTVVIDSDAVEVE